MFIFQPIFCATQKMGFFIFMSPCTKKIRKYTLVTEKFVLTGKNSANSGEEKPVPIFFLLMYNCI